MFCLSNPINFEGIEDDFISSFFGGGKLNKHKGLPDMFIRDNLNCQMNQKRFQIFKKMIQLLQKLKLLIMKIVTEVYGV